MFECEYNFSIRAMIFFAVVVFSACGSLSHFLLGIFICTFVLSAPMAEGVLAIIMSSFFSFSFFSALLRMALSSRANPVMS